MGIQAPAICPRCEKSILKTYTKKIKLAKHTQIKCPSCGLATNFYPTLEGAIRALKDLA